MSVATPPVKSPLSENGDDALQDYLDLLLRPASTAADLKPYAEPAPRPLHRTLPPLAPPAAPAQIAPTQIIPAKAVVAAAVVTETVLLERPAVKAPILDIPLIEAVPVVVSPAPAPVIEPAPVVVDVVADTAADTVAAAPSDAAQPESHTDPLQPAPWAANGRPQWAQQRFEALLFTVGGLNLAVPLVELGAIHALEGRELTPIFGQVDWFLGMLALKEGALRVIDSARVVMPERYDPEMPASYRYVITLSGSDWGLGVDTIHDSVQLEPDAVRWRSARGKRPWLAGTVVEQMCALLDASQLTWMFHSLDRQRGGARSPSGGTRSPSGRS